MPKQIRGNPRRKPPEPSTDHSAIDQWFGEVMPEQAADRAERGRVDSRGGPEPAVRRKVPPRVLRAARTRVDHRDCPYFKSVNILFLGGAGFDPRRRSGAPGAPVTSKSPLWKRDSIRTFACGLSRPATPRGGPNPHEAELSLAALSHRSGYSTTGAAAPAAKTGTLASIPPYLIADNIGRVRPDSPRRGKTVMFSIRNLGGCRCSCSARRSCG